MNAVVNESPEEATTDDQSSSNPSLNGCESGPLGTLTVSNSECEQNGGVDRSIKASDSVGDELVPPDEKLLNKIICQVEYYFSDTNIMKDTFLLKHVRRNKEGYVSLKLIASFRKVKSLTKDWRVVAYCLVRSDKLEVNQEATKIRRKDPLPEFEETSLARTVVVFHLPFREPTSGDISDIFSKFGNVSEVMIINPGDAIPANAKRCLAFYKEAASTSCAVVEFEAYDSAVKALKENSEVTGDKSGMKIVPLLSNSYKKVSPSAKAYKSPATSRNSSQKKLQGNGQRKNGRLDQVKSVDLESATSCSEAEQSPMIVRRGSAPDLAADKEKLYGRSRRSNRNKRGIASPQCNGNSSSNRGSKNINCNGRNCNGFSNRTRNNVCCCSNHPKCNDNGNFSNGNNCGSNGNPAKCICSKTPHCSEGDGTGTSPWVQRRQLAAKENGNVNNNSRFLVPEGVIRLPRGPDGTNGFHRARGETPEDSLLRSSPTLADPCRTLIVTH